MHHENHFERILTQPNPQLGMEDQASLIGTSTLCSFFKKKSSYNEAEKDYYTIQLLNNHVSAFQLKYLSRLSS